MKTDIVCEMRGYMDLLESLENGHGDYIQDIAMHDYGKQALTHVSYNAVLKFNDARSMKLFNNPL